MGKRAEHELLLPTFNISENKNYLIREPTLDDHDHVPNQEKCESEIVKYSLKRQAEDQPQTYHLLKYYVQRWLNYLTGFSAVYLTVII